MLHPILKVGGSRHKDVPSTSTYMVFARDAEQEKIALSIGYPRITKGRKGKKGIIREGICANYETAANSWAVSGYIVGLESV